MVILKKNIKSHLNNARKNERSIVEKEWERKLERSLNEQRGIYELLIQDKAMEIEMLNSIIEQNKIYMIEAEEKEINSKKILLRAKEIITCCDYEYKKHFENSARTMTQFDKIRYESELFIKQILLNK
jgi:hypothetical protein